VGADVLSAPTMRQPKCRPSSFSEGDSFLPPHPLGRPKVGFHDAGVKDLHHPVIGDLTLTYKRMELAADPSSAHDLDGRTRIQVRVGAQPSGSWAARLKSRS
jgi:hypothetical protein